MAKRGPKPKTVQNSRKPPRPSRLTADEWIGMEAPDHLNAKAAGEYRRLVVVLHERGTLATTDPRLIALYAMTWDLVCRASEELDRDGLTLQTEMGRVMAHPMIIVQNQAVLRLKGIIKSLGLSPDSARLSSPVSKADGGDQWGGLLDAVG